MDHHKEKTTEEKDQEDHKFESRWQLMEWLLLCSWKVSGL